MSFLKPKPMPQSKRFVRALIFAIPFAILLGIANFFLTQALGNMTFSVIYILMGYLIAEFIAYVSHGAQRKFRILAAVLTVVAILVSDVIFPSLYYDVNMLRYFQAYFSHLISIDGLLGLLFKAIAVGVAYQTI